MMTNKERYEEAMRTGHDFITKSTKDLLDFLREDSHNWEAFVKDYLDEEEGLYFASWDFDSPISITKSVARTIIRLD